MDMYSVMSKRLTFKLYTVLPMRTAFDVGSARSRAVFPSVFLMLGSAPCCNSTAIQTTSLQLHHVDNWTGGSAYANHNRYVDRLVICQVSTLDKIQVSVVYKTAKGKESDVVWKNFWKITIHFWSYLLHDGHSERVSHEVNWYVYSKRARDGQEQEWVWLPIQTSIFPLMAASWRGV